jgi:hypothetical protein
VSVRPAPPGTRSERDERQDPAAVEIADPTIDRGALADREEAEHGTPAGIPLPGPHPEDLIMHLERDQLVAETFRPVPRAVLSRRTRIALWGLRAFVVVVGLMVIYTFVSQLH